MGDALSCLADDRHETTQQGAAGSGTMFYLPKVVNGEPALVQEQPGRFRVVGERGVGFRISRNLEARDPRGSFAKAGDLVIGHDEGDGWILMLEHPCMQQRQDAATSTRAVVPAQPWHANQSNSYSANASSSTWAPANQNNPYSANAAPSEWARANQSNPKSTNASSSTWASSNQSNPYRANVPPSTWAPANQGNPKSANTPPRASLPANQSNPYRANVPPSTWPSNPYADARRDAKPLASSESLFTMPGKKRALLVGCNYSSSMAALSGCHEDVRRMRTLLIDTMGFLPQDVETLTDATCWPLQPTRANILSAARRLSSAACKGDLLFFHFSGHGAQVDDPSGAEEDGLNEVILPCDFKKAGMISDDELNLALVEPLPSGCRLVAVMDCCHAGTGLDLAFTSEDGVRWREDVNPLHVRADVILFSGCEDWDTSAEQRPWFAQASGVMTEAFATCIRQPHTYTSLLQAIGRHIYGKGHGQRPQLSASQRFDLSRPFSLEPGDAVPNTNQQLGRTMNKRFHPQRRMFGPLRNELEGMGYGFAMGYLASEAISSMATTNMAYTGSDAASGGAYGSTEDPGMSMDHLADADCVIA